MASCSGNGARGHHKFTLNVSESYVSGSSENYSDISWELVLSPIQNGWDWYYSSTVPVSWSVNIGGNSYTGNIMNYNGSSTVAVGSGSTRIYHNDDGSKSINFSFSVWDNVSANYFFFFFFFSDSMTLTKIARASEINCSSPYIGDTATITISKKSSSFTSTIRYAFGNLNNTLVDKTYDTVISFNTNNIKSQLYAQIPNSKQGQGTMYCDTYSGNTLIGTKSCSFYLYAKESDCKPDLTISAIDTNSDVTTLLGSNTKFLRYLSKPQVTLTPTAKYSSSIINQTISANNEYYYTLTHTFNTLENNVVTGYVRDSRGFTTTVELTLDMIDYIKLHINKLDISRPEGVSTEAFLNIDGAWYNGVIGQGTLLRNVRVGDDLSGKTLYFQIPENGFEEIADEFYGDNDDRLVISCGVNNYIEEYYWWSRFSRGGGLKLYYNGQSNADIYEKTVEQYGSEDPETTVSYTNLSSIVLPEDFGVVSGILDETAMYKYIFVLEEKNNSLEMCYQYKKTSEENWSNQITLSPTISDNTFKITNLSLGSSFDIEDEYQFKIIISDDADEISQIEVLHKGQEVIAIGDDKTWLYGDVFINDFSLVNQYSTIEVKTHKKWINDKPIYRKVIYVDGLPNGYNDSGIKSIATGISDMDIMVDMYGTFTGTGNHYDEKYPINYIRRDNSYYDISTEYKFYDGAMSLVIRSQLGEYYKGYVILEYTKTTD